MRWAATVPGKKLALAVDPSPNTKRTPRALVMQAVNEDEKKRRDIPKIPQIKTGQFIRFTVREAMKGLYSKDTDTYEGLVLGVRGRGLHTYFIVRGDREGLKWEQQIPIFSPWLKSVQIIETFKVRQSKIFWMRKMESVKPIRSKTTRRYR